MDNSVIRRLRAAVLGWYESHGRKLPWRESSDPYRIWLSEIMLQQTTVAAVVPYFQRFILRFPNVKVLADSPVDDVLKYWEGLGYYSRARNLHKAAQVLVQEYGGQFPSDVDTLITLPGIGRYTAGAIASFAFDAPAPIVEANTERLYARLLALREDVRSNASQRALWEFAGSIVPKKRAGDFNQALMDIGSQICRPQEPDCKQCPLVGCCLAFHAGLQGEVPVRKPRVAVTEVSELAVILVRRGKYLLRRRGLAERWAGMWDFVRFEIDDQECSTLPFAQRLRKLSSGGGNSSNDAAPQSAKTGNRKRTNKPLFSAEGERLSEIFDNRISQQSGMEDCEAIAGEITASMEFGYSVTRYKVRLLCYVCQAASGPTKINDSDHQWSSAAEMSELPLSATGRKIADWLLDLDRS